MKRGLQTLLVALFLLQTTAAFAITIDGGPAWPGAADTSGNSSVGNLGVISNDTWTYPNVDNSAVANLWFGLGAGPHGYSANGGGVTGNEIFSWYADTATSIEYRGSTTIVHVHAGPTTFPTRLLLTATSGATVISDAVTQALPDNVHSLFQMTGGPFVVNRRVQVESAPNVWNDANPYLTIFCTNHPSGCVSAGTETEVNTGFYWEDPIPLDQVRVPYVPLLAAFGFGLLILLGRYRKQQG